MNNLSLHQETCQPKRAGPYEQPVQDNIKKGTHSKKKDLIQKFTYRKERIQNQSAVRETCQRDFHSSAMGGVSPMKGTAFLREGIPNCREIDGLKLNLKAFKIS